MNASMMGVQVAQDAWPPTEESHDRRRCTIDKVERNRLNFVIVDLYGAYAVGSPGPGATAYLDIDPRDRRTTWHYS